MEQITAKIEPITSEEHDTLMLKAFKSEAFPVISETLDRFTADLNLQITKRPFNVMWSTTITGGEGNYGMGGGSPSNTQPNVEDTWIAANVCAIRFRKNGYHARVDVGDQTCLSPHIRSVTITLSR